ncbi:MAG: energy-coupled thiamine transporter ThiT [Pyramidobacter sp.]|jgi:thiamine transporter
MEEKRSLYRFPVEAALIIALAVVFSRIKLFRLPQGGSVTLEIVPLIILALRWGVWRGMAAGAVAGVLQWILGGYVVHPVQGLLDYPLAYAVLGLAALAGSRAWLGVVIACLARIACHVASGVVFFSSYAPEGTSPFIYSLVYNGSFMCANMVIALILVPLIMKRLKNI